jgi:hypothetical protein
MLTDTLNCAKSVAGMANTRGISNSKRLIRIGTTLRG